LGAATSVDSVALRRIDPDPEFRFAAKIEVLRRRIVFVKNGLRIEPFRSLYNLIPIKTVENLFQTGPQREHLTSLHLCRTVRRLDLQ
jgi:hypothetical protein